MIVRFTLLFTFLTGLTSIFIGIIYYQDLLLAEPYPPSFHLLLDNFVKVYSSLLVFIGLCTWWLILNGESRRVAHEETAKQTQLLLTEIAKHKITDEKLQLAMQSANNANSAKSRFLSNMSHEIRTPLNCIIGYSHILHKDPLIPDHRRKAIETLKRSGEHLSSLVEDILDIAGIEARKFELRYDTFDFHAFIDHLVSIFKVQAEDKGLLLNCQLLNRLPLKIRGDEKRIRQILINLLGNAVKFTSSGSIIFRISYRSDVATFRIIDTGEGIDEKDFDSIFQPFSRLSQSTGNATNGSGLGLTLSKILTELMGGELTVSSQPGKGSTFSVRLMLSDQTNSAPQPAEEDVIGFQGNAKNILIVDDQQEQRDLIGILLEPVGFHVFQADSGEHCLELVRNNMPDLILLDLSMGAFSGLDTVKQLRKEGHSMPVLMLSANAYPSDQQAAIDAGCNDFLAKPVTLKELLGKLKLHLSLNYIYECNSVSDLIIKSDKTLVLPPPYILEQLIKFIRIGDLLGLKNQLNELVKSESGYQDFCQRVRKLANEYRIGEIKSLLNAETGNYQ